MLDRGVERRGPPKPVAPIALVVSTVGRMILPVIGLVGAIGLVWYLRAVPARDFHFLTQIDPTLDPMADHWLTWGLVLSPLSFFVVNLINRRYGPALTLYAVMVSWIIVCSGLYWASVHSVIASLESDVASLNALVSFGVALFVGQIFCIYFFDWLRGIPWWKAPLVAALVAGLATTFAFHILYFRLEQGTFGGVWSGDIWPRLFALSALQLVWAIGQLLPTAALRRVIRPLSGFGGA